MLFLDGVGIGRKDQGVNPFFAARLPALRSILDGELPSLRNRTLASSHALSIPLDATLGVPGLPQSGTGQTALFTGVNAARLIGKHFGPYPYSTLRPTIERRSLFRRLLNGGKTCCFANAFPQRFFDYASRNGTRLTVTTLSCRYAGVPLKGADELERGEGISADLTNAGWRDLGYPEMEIIEPAEAGRRLAAISRRHDFVLFEYWKTDHAGHAKNREEAIQVLEKFDRFLVGILEGINSGETLLIITSDHGNLEDASVKTHTRNPVSLILYGHPRHRFLSLVEGSSSSKPDLCLVTPTLLRLMETEPPLTPD
jgi:2,3-bisphosphoglycerate-independent phosphoglycerate mutase